MPAAKTSPSQTPKEELTLELREHDTPWGQMFSFEDDGALHALVFEEQVNGVRDALQERHLLTLRTQSLRSPTTDALQAYIQGDLQAFDDVELRLAGTPYQQKVWRQVQGIPPGQTRTYGELAKALGNTSARAVGTANGQNLVLLAIPCHRVVGKGGKLVGYAGGLERKRQLLAHEMPVLTLL